MCYRDNDIELSVVQLKKSYYRFLGIADTLGSKLAIIGHFIFGSVLAVYKMY